LPELLTAYVIAETKMLLPDFDGSTRAGALFSPADFSRLIAAILPRHPL